MAAVRRDRSPNRGLPTPILDPRDEATHGTRLASSGKTTRGHNPHAKRGTLGHRTRSRPVSGEPDHLPHRESRAAGNQERDRLPDLGRISQPTYGQGLRERGRRRPDRPRDGTSALRSARLSWCHPRRAPPRQVVPPHQQVRSCSRGLFTQGGSSSAQLTRTWSKDWRRRPRAGQCELPDQRAPDRERSWTETYAVPKTADVHPAIIVERFISASLSRGHSRIFLADNLAHEIPLEIVERRSSNGVRSEGGVRALGPDDLSLFPLMATALPALWPAPPGNANTGE